MISFIIPAHNAEAHIQRALQPFIDAADLHNCFEVIVVENGSTDETYSLITKIAAQWSFVKVYQSDKGVSKARNKGIQMAQGEWIAFVDADDYLLPEGLWEMISISKQSKEDLWLFGHEAGSVKRSLEQGAYDESAVSAARILMLENPTRYMQVWAKLFRGGIIRDNELLFDEGMRFSEDSDFTFRYSKYCKSIMISEKLVYHYSVDNGASAMRSKTGDKAKEYARAMQKSALHLDGEEIDIKEAFEKYVLMHLNIALVREVFCLQNEKNFTGKVKQMKEVIAEPVFKEAISNTKGKDCRAVRMLPIWCLKHRLFWAAGMIYLVRAWSNARKEQPK